MSETFGDFIEERNGKEFLMINFSPNSIPLKQRWRNNGLSADFLADYWSTFFPTTSDNESAINQQAEVKNAVGYIANELLENAMKFSHGPAQYPVSIGLHLHHNELRFYVTNSVDPDTVENFKQFIHQLLTEDPDELYLQQLEANADDETLVQGGSHLGFLTMINDYGATLAWKFDKVVAEDTTNIMTVTTMVKLVV